MHTLNVGRRLPPPPPCHVRRGTRGAVGGVSTSSALGASACERCPPSVSEIGIRNLDTHFLRIIYVIALV